MKTKFGRPKGCKNISAKPKNDVVMIKPTVKNEWMPKEHLQEKKVNLT